MLPRAAVDLDLADEIFQGGMADRRAEGGRSSFASSSRLRRLAAASSVGSADVAPVRRPRSIWLLAPEVDGLAANPQVEGQIG